MTATATLLDTAEAAKRLDVKPQTLKDWRHAGRGPRYIKLGRSVRYDPADIDAYVDAHRVTPPRMIGRVR